jgi:transposase-like protein
MPRPHPPEFRERAVELARERAKPLEHVALDLGFRAELVRTMSLLGAAAVSDLDRSRLEVPEGAP